MKRSKGSPPPPVRSSPAPSRRSSARGLPSSSRNPTTSVSTSSTPSTPSSAVRSSSLLAPSRLADEQNHAAPNPSEARRTYATKRFDEGRAHHGSPERVAGWDGGAAGGLASPVPALDTPNER